MLLLLCEEGETGVFHETARNKTTLLDNTCYGEEEMASGGQSYHETKRNVSRTTRDSTQPVATSLPLLKNCDSCKSIKET